MEELRATGRDGVLIDALGWSRPAVVGRSWGGNVVVELVHRHPDAARLVVGVDGGTIDLRRRFPAEVAAVLHKAASAVG